MKKRELFVFAGQSNMMGASVLPPSDNLTIRDSFEYLHKPRRFGQKTGEFRLCSWHAGEFSYIDLGAAYHNTSDPSKNSELANFRQNTYFCPAMRNLLSEKEKTVRPFAEFSEAEHAPAASIPPLMADAWEKEGGRCAYAHIAKGGVPITYYFDAEMKAEYERLAAERIANGASLSPTITLPPMAEGAAAYFKAKVSDFFSDAEERFKEDDTSVRALFWNQGESDIFRSEDEYTLLLEVLYKRAKSLGFTHFFIFRVGYWGQPEIANIMKAQERFCEANEDCYLLTRALSYMPFDGQNEESWFVNAPSDEFRACRDSFYGYKNAHYNEKGLRVAVRHAIGNLSRALSLGLEPCLEEEPVLSLR